MFVDVRASLDQMVTALQIYVYVGRCSLKRIEGKPALLTFLSVTLTRVCFSSQVALMVAAEFWEQGDLERNVLDQQPIVSAALLHRLSPSLCPELT